MSKSPFDDLPYKDIPSLAETFAENVSIVSVQNGVFYATLTANRPDAPKPNIKKATGNKVPVVRLVMPVNGMLELHQQIDRLINGMVMQGVLVRDGSGVKPTVQ